MNKIIFFVLVISSSCAALILQEEAELITDQSGDVVYLIPKRQRQEVWAEMLIRGTHGRPYIHFVDSLYDKYFYRVVRLTTGVKDTIPPSGMNFRLHQESSATIKRAFDYEKLNFRLNLSQTETDILATSIGDSIRNDVLEAVPETDRWQWGTLERKDFITYMFSDFTQGKMDSIRNNPGGWNISPLFWRDSVIVCGETLQNLTWQELDDCVSTTTKERQWVIANIVDPLAAVLGVTRAQAAQTTIWLTMKNHPRKFSNLIFRTSKFRKYVAKWVKLE